MNATPEQLSSLSYFLKREDKFQSKLSPNGDLAYGLVLIFTGIVSLIGNGGSLAVFYYRRKHLSPAEVFLVNLGIVDILLYVTSYPCSMYSSFRHEWVFGATGCTIYGFICYFLGLACLASLTAIAVIRFLKTCHPNIGNSITCVTALKIIVGVYAYALLLACLPLGGFGRYDVEPFGLSCTLDWSAADIWNQVYIVLVTIFCVFLPTGIIVFCYSQIVLLVRKSDTLVGGTRVRRQNISDTQLTWMSGVITLGFVVGWFPYTVVSLWGAFTDEMLFPMWASPIPVIMAKSSIAYNPIIYIFLTHRYRQDFITLTRSLMFHLHICEQNAATSSEVVISNHTQKLYNNEQSPSCTNCVNANTSGRGEDISRIANTSKNSIETTCGGNYLSPNQNNLKYSPTSSSTTFSGAITTTSSIIIPNYDAVAQTKTETELIPLKRLHHENGEDVAHLQDPSAEINYSENIQSTSERSRTCGTERVSDT